MFGACKKKGFSAIITTFIGLAIAIVLVANVVMPTLMGANTSGWSTGTLAIWGVLPIVVIAGLLLMVLR
jgi:amino acid transporter